MKKIKLFIDGSCNPQKKLGIGSYLLLEDKTYDLEELKSKVISKEFSDTSSTKLELQTFIFSIEDIASKDRLIEVYTDCQNIINLPSRKEKLQALNYHSSTGKLLNNAELYKEFFALLDSYEISFVKVKGHKKNSLKDEIDKIFNIVDKASRNILRKSLY